MFGYSFLKKYLSKKKKNKENRKTRLFVFFLNTKNIKNIKFREQRIIFKEHQNDVFYVFKNYSKE